MTVRAGTTAGTTCRPWREAWRDALYSADGFYRRQLPGDHFRTASHAAATTLAGALSALARRHGLTRVVDVGCGAGELLTALAAADESLSLIGVELRPRPDALPRRIAWLDQPAELDATPTLLVGWELLDVVPATVAIADQAGDWQTVDVDDHGRETPGGRLDPADLRWCRRWAPEPGPGLRVEGLRVEIGRSREEFWTDLVRRLPNGLALAVDYGVDTASATLTGFRDGRTVRPIPDGTCDLTAHVHWPGLVRVVSALGPTTLTTQAEALTDLGVRPTKPAGQLALTDGRAYLAALQRYSADGELLDPAGLGGFRWLRTTRGDGATHRFSGNRT